ncbi:hypothetical protein [Photobacterium phosphoreum]|uniref:hypothetical protein n=1 Tax=Photobacterium phosphoreum TaxID=659 RepID=UPI0024B708DE|nr:hypothetical protein [Photobacterium phosphoreum]
MYNYVETLVNLMGLNWSKFLTYKETPYVEAVFLNASNDPDAESSIDSLGFTVAYVGRRLAGEPNSSTFNPLKSQATIRVKFKADSYTTLALSEEFVLQTMIADRVAMADGSFPNYVNIEPVYETPTGLEADVFLAGYDFYVRQSERFVPLKNLALPDIEKTDVLVRQQETNNESQN